MSQSESPPLAPNESSDQQADPRTSPALGQSPIPQEGGDSSGGMAAIDGRNLGTSQEVNGSREQPIPPNHHCPYHDAILEMHPSRIKPSDVGVFDRFMAHNPGEQYALFCRPDNGELSTVRPCTCLAREKENTGIKVDEGH